METQSSTEAVQEVAILTSSFAPEFGAGGGAVVNVVTKSGTNAIHGTGYDYLVNTALNAAQPYTGLKNAIHQNDYGFTVGGPVWIPKLYNGKNKTFFFFSFEEFYQNLINNTTPDTVPTPAYRDGNFSSLITDENRLVTTASGPYTDPLGRTIQSGTIFDPSQHIQTVERAPWFAIPSRTTTIPVTCSIPVAVKILALVPQPLGPLCRPSGHQLSRAVRRKPQILYPVHQDRSQSRLQVARGVLLPEDQHLYAPDRHGRRRPAE